MKKRCSVYSCPLLILLPSYLFAQWQPDIRITYDDSVSTTFLNYAWSIAAQEDAVHVVWDDNREGFWEIYMSYSLDNGITWEHPSRLSDQGYDSRNPHCAVAESNIYVMWCDERDGNKELYYKRSSDGGISWTPDMRLTHDPGASVSVSLAARASMIHVAWCDDRNGMNELYYKRSTDEGNSWEQDVRLTDDSLASLFPAIAATNNSVHIVWTIGWEIYHIRSTDNGTTWGGVTRLTYAPFVSWFSSVALSDSIVHVVWHDQRDGNMDIFYKRSFDNGVTWDDDTNLTFNPGVSNIPSLAASGDNVHIAWYDDRDGNYEIYYKQAVDYGTTWQDDIRLTECTGTSKAPCITLSGPYVHVVWLDERDGNSEIYYCGNPSGNAVSDRKVITLPVDSESINVYPNPFSETIYISCPACSHTSSWLKIYNVSGQLVMRYFIPAMSSLFEIQWNGRNSSGEKVPNGIYIVQYCRNNVHITRTILRIQ
jgi:hypothetical protein